MKRGPHSRSACARLPARWRDRLPYPADYFAANVRDLSRPNAFGWAVGTCPLHHDHDRSLSVHVTSERGGWRCGAGCGGGDMIGFHMLLRRLDFGAAVRELAALSGSVTG